MYPYPLNFYVSLENIHPVKIYKHLLFYILNGETK